jgi:2-furoyl-CoA dehydrogenase large subunit
MGERTAWVGLPVERVEDEALLRGEGWFMDDLDPLPHTAEAAVVRSTAAHARIRAVDVTAALEVDGVLGVLTGEQVGALSRPFPSALRAGIDYRAAAVDVARYVGEPLAVVVARDRYVAEDAAELVEVDYEPLPVAASPEAALAAGAPVLHPAVGSNVVSDRHFAYGDTEAALAGAHLVVRKTFRHPRSSCTPVEGYGVICQWDRGAVTAWSNFQGPFTLHGVTAAALGIPTSKLRLVSPPDSGGSFGVKASVYPYIVLMALASRVCGVPVRWTEDRVEHLLASSMATERLTEVEAGFSAAGDLVALRLALTDDVGAYVRAPEPATLYRMHGGITGPYRVRDVEVRSRVVVTNRCPTGLNRGFGGPQLAFALERTLAIAAARLGLDPAEVVARNLVPGEAMPYQAPAGAVYDSGDYPACFREALRLSRYHEVRAEQAANRSTAGRGPGSPPTGGARGGRPGRVIGIGLACVVEPSASNMGYITLARTAEERAGGPPMGGNAETVTIAMAPDGGVQVGFTSTPQGQGHRTVAAQIVADAVGVPPDAVTVHAGADTATRSPTVSAGNYSSRFAVTVAAAVHTAAHQLAGRLRALAAPLVGCAPEDVELVDGAARGPAGEVPLRRLAGTAHWDPAGLPDGVDGLALTVTYAVPGLAPPDPSDRVNSSAAYGFLADVAVVEIDTTTGEVEVRDYVSVHDAGRILHPALAEGQVLGGLAHGLGAALMERHVYDGDGNLLTTTFLDYPCPTATELPTPITAMIESPSPVTPTGAKGLGEGTTMSAPAAVANAVADALGVEDVELPLTPARVWALLEGG